MAQKTPPGLNAVADPAAQTLHRFTWEQLELLEGRLETCEDALAARPTQAAVDNLEDQLIKLRDELRRALQT